MSKEYSVELLKQLKAKFHAIGLYRPIHPQRYEAGDELVYEVTGLARATKALARLSIEKFVGGGFAGQVYKVKLLSCEPASIQGLCVGQSYAMKILIPPSNFSRIFRDTLYFVGFQGAFQLQVNPTASRCGAIWQKFIRRAAGIRLGDEQSVVDIYATLIDSNLGSCGELSEWVEGRTWRLEVDERLDLLNRWRKGHRVDPALLGSPEYRAKREFMRAFVRILHETGAHEFARQYEWSTCKSQPNCLKRSSKESDPSKGLVAVDFRAGLALLPFLPMSPGDFKLIFTGLLRGSLVQFDRGDLEKLECFIQSQGSAFDDMRPLLDELKAAECVYRNSTPDITHNHVRLLYSRTLWSTILKSAVTGWRVRGLVDDHSGQKLEKSKSLTLLFGTLGFIPLLGKVLRRVWCLPDWRKHYGTMLSNPGYLHKALQGRAVEKTMDWHSAGRVDEFHARRLSDSLGKFFCHLPLSILPVGLHRFLTDAKYAKERLEGLVVRPVRLYFDAQLREQWLQDMVNEGRRKHILNEPDAQMIESQLKEPFIQKYLKCLVVHMCLMPTTHIVALAVAIYFVITHPEMPRAQAYGIALGIIAVFQVIPISPGSLARGVYVLFLMIRERKFKDYNIAVFLSFFKYVGYLAFPIQMTYRYPTLARFMAAHWATEAVHVVPVFGEGGALLERKIFDLFYNWPLTIRHRMNKRAELRSAHKPRYVHILGCIVVMASAFFFLDSLLLHKFGVLPKINEIWWAAIALPFIGGAAVTLGAGGAPLNRRIAAAASCGAATGLLYPLMALGLTQSGGNALNAILVSSLWRVFIYALVSTIGAIMTELMLPEPGSELNSEAGR